MSPGALWQNRSRPVARALSSERWGVCGVSLLRRDLVVALPRRALGLLAAGLILAACQAPSAPAAARPPAATVAPAAPNAPRADTATAPAGAAAPTAAASQPSSPELVRVGVLNSISDAPFIIGRERGYFRDEGLDLELTPFDSAQQMIAPMGAGQLDVGGGAPGAGLINAFLRGVDIRLVADRSQALPGSRVMCLVVRKELLDSGAVQTAADLRGRVYAENVPANAMTYGFEQELHQGGLGPQDLSYTIVPFPDMVSAFSNGAIDTAMLLEPFITLSEARGGASCWQPLSDIVPGFQAGVLMYSPSFADHEDAARRFMVGYLRGARDYYRAFFGDGTGRPELVALLTQNTAVKDAALLERMAPNSMDPDGRVNVESLRDTQRWYLERGQIAAEVDFDRVVDPRFLDYALSRLGRYAR